MRVTLVKMCRRKEFLAFLLSLARHGVIAGEHEFVQTFDATWVHVEPLDHQSSWNIDGELSRAQSLTCTAHQGRIKVMARGIEA